MSQPYGAAVSGSSPEKGQSHRSGPNFQFLPGLPTSGTLTITIAGTPNPGAVYAILYKDKTGSDEKITGFTTGGVVDADKLNSSDGFYIADPSGATEDFIVYFSA